MNERRKSISIEGENRARPQTALIVHPDIRTSQAGGSDGRSLDSQLAEVDGLARAISLQIADIITVPVKRISPASFIGSGYVDHVASLVDQGREDREHASCRPDLVIVNHDLSPVQQRNLEIAWRVKVIDRTGLIIEIFGERARTKEGRLQVDLAALSYQRSRLVRSWTHLERQRGGAGFMGGPGETQIEIDRRIIDDQIARLKKRIEEVRKNRDLQREARNRVPFPVVALVGYTNAGKSTIFNQLTSSDVFAEDLPFATLDPTNRAIKLQSGHKIILSDTVGFIMNLPTQLIAAFRATIEQVLYADVIVHVMDVSAPDFTEQHDNVVDILEELGISYADDPRILEVRNKIDRLDPEDRGRHQTYARTRPNTIALSAVEGTGLDGFLQTCMDIIGRNHHKLCYAVPVEDGHALAWLYENAMVVQRKDTDSQIYVDVDISRPKKDQFENRFHIRPEKILT